jgi:hypothetical protein
MHVPSIHVRRHREALGDETACEKTTVELTVGTTSSGFQVLFDVLLSETALILGVLGACVLTILVGTVWLFLWAGEGLHPDRPHVGALILFGRAVWIVGTCCAAMWALAWIASWLGISVL